MLSLEVHLLSKSYNNRQVLGSISFEHERGILGISGPNGSGKSTLLKCLSGLESITGGSVRWKSDNRTLSRREILNRMGFAAPYISLYNELTVLENLKFLQRSRTDSYRARRSFETLFRSTGLGEALHQEYGSLSTGQQQRARLAAALFHNPDVLLLDEPGTNLDKEGRSLVHQITETAKEQDRLLVIASNNPEELKLCDRVFSVDTEKMI